MKTAEHNHQSLIDALEAVYADWKAIADAEQYRDKNIDALVLATLKTAKGGITAMLRHGCIVELMETKED